MTRKEALKDAIEIVSKSVIETARKQEILEGLELCMETYPFSEWTQEVIFDACEQFVSEHGQIRLADFGRKGLPSHPVIKHRFKMTAKEFRDQYFPLCRPVYPSKYRPEDKNKWTVAFINEYNRIRCTSGEHYNRDRNRELPTWNAMLRIQNVSSWSELRQKLFLPKYEPD